jgi:hypothetical protein
MDTVNISHFNFLLRNHWANCNQTLVEWSLDDPIPNLCPVIPTFNQDGRQAKNRKNGGMKCLKYVLLWNYWANLNQTLLKWSLGRRSEMPDTILEGNHPQIISAKFGWDWLSSFRGEHILNIFFLSETICSIRTKFWWNSHWIVLFQKCVRRFGPSTKMAPTAELSLT